jgi:hypothetical protein
MEKLFLHPEPLQTSQVNLERAMGFEPTTPTLATTAEINEISDLDSQSRSKNSTRD